MGQHNTTQHQQSARLAQPNGLWSFGTNNDFHFDTVGAVREQYHPHFCSFGEQ